MSFYCGCKIKNGIAMQLLDVLILISSLSFMGYGIAYFVSPKMKSEFKRFGIEKAGALTAILELLGGVGLLVGLKISIILLTSAGGLAVLMFLGVVIRIKVRDSIWLSLPALFFILLNSYIFYAAAVSK